MDASEEISENLARSKQELITALYACLDQLGFERKEKEHVYDTVEVCISQYRWWKRALQEEVSTQTTSPTPGPRQVDHTDAG